MRFFPCTQLLVRALLLVSATLLIAPTLLAAPLDGAPFQLKQPDGEEVPVLVWGDEYYQRVESLDGYTLVRDPNTHVICYADVASDSSTFLSTGVRVAVSAPAGLGLSRHLTLTSVARREQASVVRKLLESNLSVPADKDLQTPRSTLGEIQGITLLIDFSDEPGTVPAADFGDFLNLPGYTGYTNHGSVRDYFNDVSDGLLTYTNFSPNAYYRAAQPKTYYENPDIPHGQRARQLVIEALNALNASGFDFSLYDANGDGTIDALNIFYAGFPTEGWAVGLWPHSGTIYWSADGVSTYRYQITNIGNSPTLATFCHENGHMICFWPDLYDYDGDSSGVGSFCLMGSSGPANNPVEPSAPLRDLAGWCNTTELVGSIHAVPAVAAVNDVFRISHPSRSWEYYMVENRQRTDRDAGIPDSGLAIWHVDTTGSNNNQEQTPALHYFCTLVQADGDWDLEHNYNNGDTTDLWSTPDYTEFNPNTLPAATWWDGSVARIYIDGISDSRPTMTFNFRPDLGTMTVVVNVGPGDLLGPWQVEGPNGYLVEDVGDRTLLVWDEGLYTLTWLDLPGWTLPEPGSLSDTITSNGMPISFTGTYLDPPFTAITTGPLGDAGPGRGVSIVDVDGDGLLDIYVCNRGAANLLLHNDGGLAFSDVATGLLADAGPTMAAVWADLDNDGDQDAYLSRDGAANQLLEQGDGGSFTDIAMFGVENSGPGRAVSFVDTDLDGKLDLYLVNNSTASQLFHSYGDLGTGHFALFPQSVPLLESTGPGTAAPWCDSDLDGDSDVYLVNRGQPNALIINWDGQQFQPGSGLTDPSNSEAAAWADLDGDGDMDVYVVNDGGSDRVYRNDGGNFNLIIDPILGDAGHGRGLAVADLNNDGLLDLYVTRFGELDLLYFGTGGGSFVASAMGIPATEAGCTAVACGDLDGDGGLDLYLSRDGQPNVLLHNTIANRGHWLQLDLRADGEVTNVDAVGARVRLVAGGQVQVRQVQAGGESLAQHSRTLSFGLGAATQADSIIVNWPGGGQRVLTQVTGDRRLVINQDAITAVNNDIPAATGLRAPYPNPFNPSTTIAFDLARPGSVEVAVFAVDGHRVATLVADELGAGRHEVIWQGRDGQDRAVASGAYFLRLRTTEGTWSQRLTLVK